MDAPSPSRVGMLLDLSVCIGCRACQVACKEWNELPAERTRQHGTYQNPPALTGDTWKQVKFVETTDETGGARWIFYSDSCKHCFDAPCMRACPTGAIGRTEAGVIRVDPAVCNGNGHCVPACPFGVIGISETAQVARKCTMCEERLDEGLEPACAAVCPTDCITFGGWSGLLEHGRARVAALKERGRGGARVYGATELGGLGVMYVLTEAPEVYGLPVDPVPPGARVLPASALSIVWGALAFVLAAWVWARPL